MLTVEVTVEHFLDAGEQDANGDWDYFYEGDLFTFSADTNSHGAILKARIYSDTTTRASFIEQRVKLETSPLTDEAVAYLPVAGRQRSIASGRSDTASGRQPTNTRSCRE